MKRTPETFGAALAARWAHRLRLPRGNYWEPTIARHVAREVRRLGADGNAYAFVQALTERQLGLDIADEEDEARADRMAAQLREEA